MSASTRRQRHISVAQSTADGVTRTDIHITQLEITCAKDDHEDCFHPEVVCDAEERALIEQLRAYLRPSVAPLRLVARLEQTLDRCCDEGHETR